MPQSIYTLFSRVLPTERLHDSEEILRAHASDETEDLVFMPGVVAEPNSTSEVSALLQIAYDNDIPKIEVEPELD